MSNKKELYFSLDIETDGQIPGEYSMLSLGLSALDTTGKEHGTFYINLKTLPGAGQNPSTMEWWKGFPEAWDAHRVDPQEPEVAMKQMNSWVREICGQTYAPVCVAMPAAFDFMFLYWYLIKFAGESSFGFSCIDMKTMAMTMKKAPYRESSKQHWPERWFSKLPHTHNALDDAREQGQTFINMFKELANGKKN